MGKNILLIFLVITNKVVAQEAKLLNNYKFRFDKYRTINLTPSTGSGTTQTKDLVGINKSSGYSFYGLGIYNTIKSFDNLMETKSFGFGSNVNGSKSTSSSGTNNSQKDRYINPQLNYNLKLYKKLNYIELGLGAKATYGKSNYEQTFTGGFNNGKKKVDAYTVNPVIGIGAGRLENIVDMQNALWLKEALQKANVAKDKISNLEMVRLATEITTASNTRILDNRKRVQHILRRVHKYLTEKNIVTNADIEYFTALNDILFYTNTTPRFTGKDLYVRLSPTLRKNNSPFVQTGLITNNVEEKVDNREVQLQIGYKRYKAINLKNQFNYGIELVGTTGKENYNYKQVQGTTTVANIAQNTKWKEWGINHFIAYEYYPNTRTIVSAELRGNNGIYYTSTIKDGFDNNELEVVASYFISFNTRINAGLIFRNQNIDYRFIQANSYSSKGRTTNFNIGVDFTF